MVEIDTTNKFLVSARGDNVVLLKPVQIFSKEDAVLFAAWLLALSEASTERFEEVYEAVCNT